MSSGYQRASGSGGDIGRIMSPHQLAATRGVTRLAEQL